MRLVDAALQEREVGTPPIRVALLGAGFMAQGLSGIYGRKPQYAIDICAYTGVKDFADPKDQLETDLAIRGGKVVVTDDAFYLACSLEADVPGDTTGSVEFGYRVVGVIAAFGPRERKIWFGGCLRHERLFGRNRRPQRDGKR